jgi:hypothetical protein
MPESNGFASATRDSMLPPSTRWFSPIGRAYYLEMTYRFGGND